jgi:hypothetical protein
MYSVTALYPDGKSADVTSFATWTSSNPRVVAPPDGSGAAHALEVGAATLSAQLGAQVAQTSVDVK